MRGRGLSRLIAMLVVALAFGMSAALLPAAPVDQERWDEKYREETYRFGKDTIPFLREHVGLLPKGLVLDLAMGEGRNAVFLAAQGFDVLGIDISARAISKAHALAQERGTRIRTEQVDLETYQLRSNTYDVIVCTYYLERTMIPQIKAALKPGGMVVLETYTVEHLKYRPDFNPAYLLTTNEWLDLFDDFTILRYQLRDDGTSVYASLVARKP